MRILIIEDEKRLSDNIKKGLTEEGFAVDVAYDGEDGQYMAQEETYDAIILDLSLPKIDGVTLCKNLRRKGIKTPILMLTARTTLSDKIAGLDSGADDYLTKPFAFAELRSRLHALIRRSKRDSSPTLEVADLTLNPLKHTVTRNDKRLALTPKEFAILELLLRHKGEVVSRSSIIDHVWDYNFEGMSNVVDVFVANLRKKIEYGVKNRLIHTVHGVGYTIKE